ncbi:hypothetical protein D3C77_673230 [compost metagenome]
MLKKVGQTEANCRVAVVAAGVHHTGVTGGKTVAERAVTVIERFAEIQGVHVHPKGEGWAGASGV